MSKKRNTKHIHLAKQRAEKKRAKMRKAAAKKRHVRLVKKRAETRRQPHAPEPVAVTASTPSDARVEPRDENIPDGIERVDYGVDSNGARDGTYHVTTRSSPESQPVIHVLSASALLLGNRTQVAEMLGKLALPAGKSRWDLAEFSRLLPLAAIQPMWVAGHDGYHRISYNGVDVEVFSFDGELYCFGEKPMLLMRAAPLGPKLIKRAGTVAKWQKTIGAQLAANPYLLIAVSTALAAPMTKPFGFLNGTLGLVGESGTGKSSTQRVANGLTGRDDDVQLAVGTELGLREWAEARADEQACIEEPRQMANPGWLQNLAYDVSGGGHRLISRASHAPRSPSPLRCNLIFSNELGLREMTSNSRVRVDEGAEARVFEIRVNAPFGAFHFVPPGMTAAEFADYLSQCATDSNGAVWPVWLPMLADRATLIRRWKVKHFATLIDAIDPHYEQRKSVQKRSVNLMASWAFAGCVAAQLKLLPVRRDEVVSAFASVIAEKFAADERSGTTFDDDVVSFMRHIVDAHSAKFPPLSQATAGAAHGTYGYRTQRDGRDVLLFFPTVLVKLVGAKFGMDVALAKLKASGFLITNSAGFQLQVDMPGQQEKDGKRKRKRFYAIDAAISFDAPE